MEYHSRVDYNKMVLDHLAHLSVLVRDYIKNDSMALKSQWIKYLEHVDKWYEIGLITIDTYSKANMVVDYLIHAKERLKDYEKTETLHISE